VGAFFSLLTSNIHKILILFTTVHLRQRLKKEYLKAFEEFKNSNYYKDLKELIRSIMLSNEEPKWVVFSNYPLIIAGLDCASFSYLVSEIALEEGLNKFSVKKFLFEDSGNSHYVVYDKEKETYHDFGYLLFNIKREKGGSFKKTEKRLGSKGLYCLKIIIDEKEGCEKIIINPNKTKIIKCLLVKEFEVEEFYYLFLEEKLNSIEKRDKFHIFEKKTSENSENAEKIYRIKGESFNHENIFSSREYVKKKLQEFYKKVKESLKVLQKN